MQHTSIDNLAILMYYVSNQQSSVEEEFMKKITYIALSVLSLVVFAAITSRTAPVAAAECNVSVVGTVDQINGAGARFHANAAGDKVSANVVVSGDTDCTQTVTIVSWEAPNAVFNLDNIKAQKIHSYTTKTFGVGTHTISTSMKDCYYQIDLLNSNRPTAADGTANYQAEDRLIGWAQGGTKSCVAPTPTPTPTPVPTPAPTTPQPTPTALPNTGAGNVIGIFAAVAVAGAAFHAFVTKKRQARF